MLHTQLLKTMNIHLNRYIINQYTYANRNKKESNLLCFNDIDKHKSHPNQTILPW